MSASFWDASRAFLQESMKLPTRVLSCPMIVTKIKHPKKKATLGGRHLEIKHVRQTIIFRFILTALSTVAL